jgi:cytochrome P450 / NADPH-cytochrome P450 reductase
MDTRFNSFYREEVSPYVKAMVGLLTETQLRTYRPPWYTYWQREANLKFEENNALVHQLAVNVISKRRAQPSSRKDLVDAMLNGVDPKTGKKLDDNTIIDNMITFFIAGELFFNTRSALHTFLNHPSKDTRPPPVYYHFSWPFSY